jgi:hypothetical protein
MFLLHIVDIKNDKEKKGHQPWPEGDRRNPICADWYTSMKNQPDGSRRKEVFWYITFACWLRL